MVREAEEFASEDEAQRKRIEALNGLQNFVRASTIVLSRSHTNHTACLGLGTQVSAR